MTRVFIEHGQYLKTGDTRPQLRAQLIKSNDAPKDLSSVDTVEIHIAEADSDSLAGDGELGQEIAAVDLVSGRVEFDWSTVDTTVDRTLLGEFVVTENGEQSSYPNNGEFEIYIEEGLA